MSATAKNFEAIASAKKQHDGSCDFPAHTVVMCPHDIERLGWEEGDTVAGLKLAAGDVQPDRFELLCDKPPRTGGGASTSTAETSKRRELQPV